MNKIILQLTEDHHRKDELLNLLSQEITGFNSGDDLDYRFVLGILDYFNYQPDVFHHPREELIFDQLGVNGGAKLVHPGGAKLVHLM